MPRSLPGWIGKTHDASIPEKVQLRVINRQRPAANELPICPDCGLPIRGGDGLDIDHAIALADGGAHAEDNLRAVHRRCHKLKTAREALARTAHRKVTAKVYSLKKSSNPLPGSRASGIRKRMNGSVEKW